MVDVCGLFFYGWWAARDISSRSAIGRVRSSRGVCTGTLIGRRLVITASHCVCSGCPVHYLTLTRYYAAE